LVATALTRRIDGLIVSNTNGRRLRRSPRGTAAKAAALSGRPLFEPSTRLLARAYLLTGGAMPLIGCGGVEDSETALAKIEAGANLVQLYTGLALKGYGIVEPILVGLSRALKRAGSTGSANWSAPGRASGAGSETTEADAYATSD